MSDIERTIDPWKLTEVESSAPPHGWAAKGHHEADAFLAACEWEFETPPKGFVARREDVRHGWWRNVPFQGTSEMFTHPAKPGSRGAYPVTYVEFEREARP